MTSVFLKRFFVNVCVLLVIQIGTFIPILELNSRNINSKIFEKLNQINIHLISNTDQNTKVFLGFFSLNIFPYLKAIILLQLLINIFPQLKIKNSIFYWSFGYYTRFLTLGFSTIQTIKILLLVKNIIPNLSFLSVCEISLWLINGSMIILWLTEIIDEYGLGNGISLFFYLQILSNISNFVQQFMIKQKNIYLLFVSAIFILSSLYGIIFIEQGIKKIWLMIPKSLSTRLPFLNSNYNYIPLRFNQAGIFPIMLTVFILNFIFDSYNLFYWVFYFLFIIYFSVSYSVILIDLIDLSNQLRKIAGSIRGLKPGFETLFYLKETIKRVTLVGSIILAIFAIILNLIEFRFNGIKSNSLSLTTYLLISIGVFLDLMREIENIYFFSAYK